MKDVFGDKLLENRVGSLFQRKHVVGDKLHKTYGGGSLLQRQKGWVDRTCLVRGVGHVARNTCPQLSHRDALLPDDPVQLSRPLGPISDPRTPNNHLWSFVASVFTQVYNTIMGYSVLCFLKKCNPRDDAACSCLHTVSWAFESRYFVAVIMLLSFTHPPGRN